MTATNRSKRKRQAAGKLDKKLRRLAERHGWARPRPGRESRFPPEVWNEYWSAMRRAQRGEIEGRPIPPHIPGGSLGRGLA